jgi:hypothetical protein
MITHENQLTIGRELWHVYGHLDCSAQKIKVLSEVHTETVHNYTFKSVEVLQYYGEDEAFQRPMHLKDVGIGANYNMNRLFETEQEALAFWHSPECVEYRERQQELDNLVDEDLDSESY